MKKLSFIAALLALFCCLSSCSFLSGSDTSISKKEESAFIDEIGGCSETYTGALSENTYYDAVEAAHAYVLEEIAKEDSEYTIEAAVCEGTPSNDELQAAGVSSDLLDGATSVQKYTVTYTEDGQDSDSTSELSTGNQKTVVVYVVGGDDWFKYFSPVVVTGNTVTKSYYDSIFHSEKFNNCTIVQNSKISVKAGIFVFSETVETTLTSTMKYADNKIYIEEKIESDVESENSDLKLYIELSEDGWVENCYLNENGYWEDAYLRDKSLLTPFGDQFLHYSYFTKTDYGCTLEKENLKAYLAQSLDELNLSGDMEVDGSVNYYVTDGVLNGIMNKIVVKMELEGVSVTESITSTVKCIDYGTTQIESPINK